MESRVSEKAQNLVRNNKLKKWFFSLSNSRLPAVDVGTNVVVRVPELDRGHLAPRNVQAVVIDVSSSGPLSVGHEGRPT